jgi:hypothetical protein
MLTSMKVAGWMLVVAALASCADPSAPPADRAARSPMTVASASPIRAPDLTKPPELLIQRPLGAPTHLSWGIDRGAPDDPAHRHLFEVYFDGAATGFRIIDGSGQLVLELPIAGSGIFDASTCMATAKPDASTATWVPIDDVTLERLTASGASFSVVVDTIGVAGVTLPLVDTGCRSS